MASPIEECGHSCTCSIIRHAIAEDRDSFVEDRPGTTISDRSPTKGGTKMELVRRRTLRRRAEHHASRRESADSSAADGGNRRARSMVSRSAFDDRLASAEGPFADFAAWIAEHGADPGRRRCRRPRAASERARDVADQRRRCSRTWSSRKEARASCPSPARRKRATVRSSGRFIRTICAAVAKAG